MTIREPSGEAVLPVMTVREPSGKALLPVLEIEEDVDILVVEDNEHQRESIVSTLRASIPDVCVGSTSDGEEALDFLLARGAYVNRAGQDPPKLILLDLALPDSHGISVLGQIRAIEPQDGFTVAPVVIFSDSQAEVDIRDSYRCGANSYIIKPLSYHDFKAVVEAVGQYWMNHNKSSE